MYLQLIKIYSPIKQVHHQQIVLVFKYKALLHVSATVRSHLKGVSVLKVIQRSCTAFQ